MAIGETTAELELLGVLDKLIFHPQVQAALSQKAQQAKEFLNRDTEQVSFSVAIDLDLFAGKLPAEIKSSRVFVLRAGAKSRVERHPNSHQRVVSFDGRGSIMTLEEASWKSNEVSSDRAAALSARWVSVEANVWHQPVAGADDWVSMAFHTAADEGLIDEYWQVGCIIE